jgi:hypothetical protein
MSLGSTTGGMPGNALLAAPSGNAAIGQIAKASRSGQQFRTWTSF